MGQELPFIGPAWPLQVCAGLRGTPVFPYHVPMMRQSELLPQELPPEPLVRVALAPAAIHFAWQVMTLRPADGANALHRFRSNRYAGLLVFLACFVVGQTSF